MCQGVELGRYIVVVPATPLCNNCRRFRVRQELRISCGKQTAECPLRRIGMAEVARDCSALVDAVDQGLAAAATPASDT